MAQETTEAAGKVAAKAKGVGARLMGEHGIFRRLKEEHAEVSVMLRRLLASDDIDVRRELFPKIRRELLGHSKAEEEELYALLQQHAETSERVSESYREHGEIEDCLARLAAGDYASSEWVRDAEDLQRIVKHHVDEEENILLPRAEDLIDKERAKEIEDRFLANKERVMEQVV